MMRNILSALIVTALSLSMATAETIEFRQSTGSASDFPVQRMKVPIQPKKEAPNRLFGKKASYSGVGPQLVKTKYPLNLINPVAGPEHGQSYQNVSRNIFTGDAEGIILLSIEF